MAPGSDKKIPARAGRTPAQTRRSPSKLAKAASTPLTPVTPKTPVKKTAREYNYTSRLPTEEQRRGNGRVPGRNLISWNRPRMMEKMMLHLVHACNERKIELPWDQVAHSMNPGSSGNACTQHLVRLRKELIAEGHLVPPPPHRHGSSPIDRDIRGYVRKDQDGGNKYETRPVLFSEKYEDRRFNLPDAFGVHEESMADPFQDEEAETESDDFSESPSSQSHNFQASAESQYTEQSSPMNSYVPSPMNGYEQEGLYATQPSVQQGSPHMYAQLHALQQGSTTAHGSTPSAIPLTPSPKQQFQNSDFGPYKQPFWDASTSECKGEEWVEFPDIPDISDYVLYGHNRNSSTSSTNSFGQPPVYGGMSNDHYEQWSDLFESIRR
ncbi:hypothetical protein EDB81DRAFT_855035 [Dactylonectria macrodidyma]|uniref:Uncharacterized protein n=1 Tax=Dactylonectria macrodidyma TaxID=307937 RepID=A0A9P9FB09_9HYPO|nr:hypothetical protein EDB81DRAFT_855035 [Dactylonectria macrodidyma]